MAILINVSKLHQELANAKLPVISVHSDGKVEYSRSLTKAEETSAQSVIAAHDPAPVPIPTTDQLLHALWLKVMRSDPSEADELNNTYPQD
jgi:hypothetical protein